jgi:hypothetical protein
VESLPALDGKLITADPLHCQRKLARAIVEKGGDYLLQIKGNHPHLLQKAQGLDGLKETPFSPTPSLLADHFPDQPLPPIREQLHSRPHQCLDILCS